MITKSRSFVQNLSAGLTCGSIIVAAMTAPALAGGTVACPQSSICCSKESLCGVVACDSNSHVGGNCDCCYQTGGGYNCCHLYPPTIGCSQGCGLGL